MHIVKHELNKLYDLLTIELASYNYVESVFYIDSGTSMPVVVL